MVTLLNPKTIVLTITLLVSMSIITLYTLFSNSIFGMTTTNSNIDSFQPVIVSSLENRNKKQNPWTNKMIHHLIKSKKKSKVYKPNPNKSRNTFKHKHIGRISKLKNNNKTQKKRSPPDPNRVKNHKPFTFLIGMNKIKEEYNKSISNLKAIDINYETSELTHPYNKRCVHKKRVFVLGIMKTGTTSMTNALSHLGYHCTHNSCIHLGNWFHFIDTVHLWQPFEVITLSILNMTDLLKEYITTSNAALAFGDSPWCFLYPIFDKLYPNSKFILMTRKDDKTYINSYLRYLIKYGKKFVNKGLNNEQFALIALRRYHLHNERVRNYFKNRQNDLLEIVVGDMNDENINVNPWDKIVTFLGCKKPKRKFPHENKSTRGGKVRKYKPIDIDIKEDKWNWKKTFGDDIPYLIRNLNESHSLKVVSKDKFIFDWNLFIVDELKVNNSLSNVTVFME